MKKKLLGLVLMLLLAATTVILPQTDAVSGLTGETYTAKISGTWDYSGGQEMINYMNEERGLLGAKALRLDSQLTDAAMQRAAEIAYFFDHNRPDGSDCFTIHSRAHGENIAAGYSTAWGTFNQWMNSDGHRANMMRTTFTSVGIGHFYHNGTHYWVQLFGWDGKNYPETRTGTLNGSTTLKIQETISPVLLDDGTLSPENPLNLILGKNHGVLLSAENVDWEDVFCVFDGDSFSWTSTDPSVATVSEDGVVSAVGIGQATIKASAKSGSITGLYFDVNVGKDITKTTVNSIAPVTYSGKAHTPAISVYDGSKQLLEGKDYTLTYRNNIAAGTGYGVIEGKGIYKGTVSVPFTIKPLDLTEIAKVQLDGWNSAGYDNGLNFVKDKLTIEYEGTVLKHMQDYRVTRVVTSGELIRSAEIDFIGNYTGDLSIRNLDTYISTLIDKQEYTGKPIEPILNRSLKPGVDYIAEFSNNVNVGTAKVVITGLGSYIGNIERTFDIVPADIEDQEITIAPEVFTYDGTQKKPEVSIKGLTDGKDYAVSYENNINAGSGSVIISGQGNYSGTVKKTFEIEPKHMMGVTTSNVEVTYDGKAHTFDIRNLPEGAEVKYQLENGWYVFDKPTITDVGRLSVRYTVSKKNYYTTGGSVSVTVLQATLPTDISLEFKQAVFTGDELKPGVTVKDKEKILAEGLDYTVSYNYNRNVGEASVWITGKGNYTGSQVVHFTIIPKKPTSASAKLYGHDDVKFTWAASQGASGYHVYYKKSTASKWTSLGKTTNLYKKKANLSDGVKYQFKVVPYYKGTDGKTYSSSAQYKTATVTTLKKVSLRSVVKSSSKSKVKWKDISGESGYQISRSTKKSGTNIVFKSVKSGTTSKLVTATKGKTYYYKVRAYKTVDGKKIYGPWSAVKKYKRK